MASLVFDRVQVFALPPAPDPRFEVCPRERGSLSLTGSELRVRHLYAPDFVWLVDDLSGLSAKLAALKRQTCLPHPTLASSASTAVTVAMPSSAFSVYHV